MFQRETWLILATTKSRQPVFLSIFNINPIGSKQIHILLLLKARPCVRKRNNEWRRTRKKKQVIVYRFTFKKRWFSFFISSISTCHLCVLSYFLYFDFKRDMWRVKMSISKYRFKIWVYFLILDKSL